MDPATINTNTFTLQEGTKPVPGRVSTPANAPASFTQTSEFKPDTLYTGRITTGARDLAGNALKNDFIWKFRTAPTPEPVVITKVETKIKTKEVIVNKFVMLTGTHFAFDSSDLTPAGKELIKQNIKIMKDNPAIRVQIQGHSSAAGSEQYNQALSERRANSVRDYVINEGGIAPERLEAIGYGETRPAMNEVNPADHNSKEAKANMRVVFEIIEK
jgi:OOP family OmpA-OmpF porin